MLLSVVFLMLAPLPLQGAPPPPNSPRWQMLAGDSEGAYSIEPTTIQWQGRRARVYVRAELQVDELGPLTTGVHRAVYDCNAKTFRIEYSIWYRRNGEVESEGTIPMAERVDDPIQSPSANAIILAHICK